ncbi:Serine carboxypeptidase-like 18-like protein [Drosera capensis]
MAAAEAGKGCSRWTMTCLAVSLLVSASCLGSYVAVARTTIEYLPGFDGRLPFKFETGYVGVGEREDVQLFYYFFESENSPEEAPLLLWLTGGPGCSTISAIFYENGPIQFEEVKFNGSLPRLTSRPYAWTEVVNLIYVDMPVGTGFSYSVTGGSHSSDTIASHHANEFLRKWIIGHPKFISNPVYLAGDSYSGLTLPVYFDQMSKGNDQGVEPFINLKGYLLGNAVTDHTFDDNSGVPYAHGLGLISDELYESLVSSCGGKYQFTFATSYECMTNLSAYYESVAGLNTVHILEPLCGFGSLFPREILVGARRSLYFKDIPIKPMQPKPSLGDFACRTDGYILAAVWFNDLRVREALGVRKVNKFLAFSSPYPICGGHLGFARKVVSECLIRAVQNSGNFDMRIWGHIKYRLLGTTGMWVRCNYGLNYTNDNPSSLPYHLKFSAKGYRSLIYSGDHDMVVPFLGTQAWIRSLNFSIVDDWRSWHVEGQVAGFTRTYSNRMTFATVKGAGHTAPEYKPKECAAMFKRWLRGEPL